MRSKTLWAVGAAAALAAACGDGGDSGSGQDGEATAARESCDAQVAGGTLTFATGSPTVGLDPTQVFGAASTGGIEGTALFDTLLRYDPETGDYVPQVAESFEQTGDLEWTVILRDGITFGNGKALTAADLVANLDRMKAAQVSSAALAALIDGIEVVDDRTAVYQLAQPWGEFPYFLAEEGGMIVDVAVADQRGADGFNSNPQGAGVGPYEFERFAPGEEVVLTAKDDYWGGPVCIETLRFISPGGAQAALDAMRSQEIDAAFMTDPMVASEAGEAGLDVDEVISGAGSVLLLNQGAHGTTGPTHDLRVRQAVVAALDVDLIEERVSNGEGLATSSLVWEDQAIHPDVPGPVFDPDRATELVEEAKAAGWDGRVDLLCGDTPDAQERSLVIEGLLEAVGMTVGVETLDSPTLFDRVANQGDYDIACWGGNIPDASPWATVLTQYSSDSPANRVGLADPDMDAALVGLREATDASERRDAMAGVQEAWNETTPAAILTAQQWFIVTSSRVHGVVMTRDAIPMFHVAFLEG
jgi:peptide/nickel transport system substrate-binding protein